MADQDTDWWSQNAPSAPVTSGADRASAIAQYYQQYTGRTMDQITADPGYQGWVNGGLTLDQVKAAIQGSPEAQQYTAKQASATQGGGATGDGVQTPSGMLSAADKATIDGLLKNAQSTDDPNYWYNLAAQHGGVDSTGVDWLTGRINQGDGALAVRNGTVKPFQDTSSAASGPVSGSTLFNLASLGGVSAPAYTPYTVTAAPTATQFVAPTAAEAAATPGFQSAIDTANQGLQRTAAAKGGLLSGGTLRDISDYDIGLANQNYQNVYNNALSANQLNNQNAYNQWSANTNAGLSAAGLNLNGVNTSFGNQLNAANSQFGNQLSAANYGLGQQNQYWNQGLAENQNAYNQYNTNQTNAFNQWLATATLGNPGNPYTS
jgi:hypothetical protein